MPSIPKSIDLGTLKYGTTSIELPMVRLYQEYEDDFAFLMGKEAHFKFSLLNDHSYRIYTYSFISSQRKQITGVLYSYEESLHEVKRDSATGANSELDIQLDCKESGEYLLSIHYSGTSRVSIQIKCIPTKWQNKSINLAQPQSESDVIRRLIKKVSQQYHSKGQNGKDQTNGKQNHSQKSDLQFSEIHENDVSNQREEQFELYSVHVGFEVELFSYLENKPSNTYRNVLTGSDSSSVTFLQDPDNELQQLLVYKHNQLMVPVARTGPGNTICGMTFGNQNSILVLIQNHAGIFKVYKISGFSKPRELIAEGLKYPPSVLNQSEMVFPNENQQNSKPGRNELVEGRRQTGDRRSGTDRRNQPNPGRRVSSDRRHRTIGDRRQKQ